MRRLLALCIFWVAPIAAALPAIGPATKLTPQGPAEGQRHARSAASDSDFLVVWEAGIGGQSKIRAARVALAALNVS